jgi:hypothetical protein
MSHRWKILGVLCTAFFLATCYYPIQQSNRINKGELRSGGYVTASTKVHMSDGSVVLLDTGFTCAHDIITGYGTRYDLARKTESISNWNLPLDSVVGLEYYDKRISGGRRPGTMLLGLTTIGAIGAVAGILAFTIFGSYLASD